MFSLSLSSLTPHLVFEPDESRLLSRVVSGVVSLSVGRGLDSVYPTDDDDGVVDAIIFGGVVDIMKWRERIKSPVLVVRIEKVVGLL